MGLDAVPEDVGSGTSQGQVQVPKSLPLLLLLPSQQLQAGLAQVSHGAAPILPPALLLPQAARCARKGISSPFSGCWDSSPVFWCELGLELQPLDLEHPQQSQIPVQNPRAHPPQ